MIAAAENAIDALDDSVFDRIASQTTSADRRSLLAVQSATARHFGAYCYLEIGSHLGGSIQPHLLDPRCRRIHSIDPRPGSQPDNRGFRCEYPQNSTRRMLENLREVAGSAALERVSTHECTAAQLDPRRIESPPHLCFIDGEHTTEAVLADFALCDRVRHHDAAICLHDGDVVWVALRRILRALRSRRADVEALKLGGSVVALAFGQSPVRRDAVIAALRRSSSIFFLRAAALDLRRRAGRALRRAA